MSHFLEHMSFKGTSKRTWDQINKDVDALGALWNAYTWWEGTAYFHWVQAERVADSIEILSDMMRPSLLREDFDTEKNVILEEIAMYNDNPSALIADHLIQVIYGDHPLGTSVLGTKETVSAIRHEDLVGYHARRYAPEDMVFVATGAVDRDAILETVERYTGSWREKADEQSRPEPPFLTGTHVIHRPTVSRQHLAMAWRGPETGSSDEPVARVLARYLGDRENSRLYWAVKQKGLVERVGASHFGFKDSGFLYVHASSGPENSRRVYDLIREELLKAHRAVDEDALERSRTKAVSALVREAENGLNRWMQLAERESAGATVKTIRMSINEIEEVTPDRIRQYLDEFPLSEDPALVSLGPLERF